MARLRAISVTAETKPLLSQQRLLEIVSARCDLAIVLFDEIEKASPAVTTLLLGLLDKATLRLGDNSEVDFEKVLIFLTSNLGARDMIREAQPDIGFQPVDARSAADIAGRLKSIGLAAVRKRFSPEFVNRLDALITYRPLDAAALAQILEAHVVELQKHVHTRLGERSFDIEVTPPAREVLLERSASSEYGARELKRTIHRMLTQPLAAVVAGGQVEPGGRVIVERADDGQSLALRFEAPAVRVSRPAASSVVLLLDDNVELLTLLERGLARLGVAARTATSSEEGRRVAAAGPVDLAFIDFMLPDGDGLSFALELLRRWPAVRVVLMTGGELSSDEIALCARQDFPILRKPFLVPEVISLVNAAVLHPAAPGPSVRPA